MCVCVCVRQQRVKQCSRPYSPAEFWMDAPLFVFPAEEEKLQEEISAREKEQSEEKRSGNGEKPG